MSIKINKGYKIKKQHINELVNFNQFVSSLRNEAIEKLKVDFKLKIEHRIVTFFYHYLLKNNFRTEIGLNYSSDFVCPTLNNVSIFDIFKSSIFIDDIYFNVQLYPSGNYFLCSFFDNLDYKPTHPILIPYIYYDNTDKPESISASEWKKRRRLWLNAFDNKNDLLINILNENIIISTFNSVIDNIPVFDFFYEKRMKLYLADILYYDLLQEEPSFHHIDFTDKFLEGFYDEKIKCMMNEFKQIIPKEISYRKFIEQFRFDVVDNKIIFKYFVDSLNKV